MTFLANPVVTVTPTIQDGQVVRWYEGMESANAVLPVVTASRNGVTVAADFCLSTGEIEALIVVMRKACEAGVALCRGEDLRSLATHRRRGLTGPLEPVAVGVPDVE